MLLEKMGGTPCDRLDSVNLLKRLLALPEVNHQGVRTGCSGYLIKGWRAHLKADNFSKLPTCASTAAVKCARTVNVCGARVLPVFEDGMVLPVIDIGPQDIDSYVGQWGMVLLVCAIRKFKVRSMQYNRDGVFVGRRIGAANALKMECGRWRCCLG